MTPIIFAEVRSAMAQDASFSAYKNNSGEWHVKKRSVWGRIFFWKDHDYHTKRINRIAKALTAGMRELPHMDIKVALKDDSLKIARKFLRSLNSGRFYDHHVNICCRQLLAAKLGLNIDVFIHNPGFEEFAYNSHIERYLADFGHEIRVDPESKEVSLMLEGRYQPWSVVKERVDELPPPEKNQPDNPRQMWLYGQNGIQKKDMYAWKELQPYKIVEPTWGDRYLFEFTTCCNPSQGLNGDHSWVELKTPSGEVYSAGLYRPGKPHYWDTFHYPLRVKKGYLMSPDVSNWWPTPIYRIPVEITKEQFEKIKKSIEEDKADEEKRHFQLFNGNCQEYVNEKAEIAGIKLDTSVFVLRNITPIKLQNVYDRIKGYLPNLVLKVFYYAATVLLNIGQWILGASIKDEEVKKKGIEVKPIIRSFKDIFDPKKLYFHPPRHTGLTLRKEIEEWREKQIADIPEERTKEREAMRYALPPECYL